MNTMTRRSCLACLLAWSMVGGITSLMLATQAHAQVLAKQSDAGLTSQSLENVSTLQVQEATAFWHKFRLALLSEDEKSLIAMTQFPLTLRGVADFQKPKRIGKNQLLQVLRRVMKEEINPDDASPSQSLSHYVVATTSLKPLCWVSATDLSVENFSFIKGKSGWKLVTVYTDDLEAF